MPLYDYFCTKCKVEIETDEDGYIECPKCGSHRYIRDFGDYESAVWESQDFNWNKR